MLAQLSQAEGFYPLIFDILLFQVLEVLCPSMLILRRTATKQKVGVSLVEDEAAIFG